MKLKKIGVTGIAIALLVGGGATNYTYAMETQEQILNNADITPYISAEGMTLYPEVYIKAKGSSGSISGTMYLEKYSFGRWRWVYNER